MMIAEALFGWLVRNIVQRRQPDFVIGGSADPYLRRWWLIPRNRFFNLYLHQFLRSDEDRALHDHPWLFNASFLLSGQYVEHTIKAGGIEVRTRRRAGDFKLRLGPAPHRVELLTLSDFVETQPENRTPVSCWTLFITGPVVRHWGFHCRERGWVHWRDFTAGDNGELVGRGCD